MLAYADKYTLLESLRSIRQHTSAYVIRMLAYAGKYTLLESLSSMPSGDTLRTYADVC